MFDIVGACTPDLLLRRRHLNAAMGRLDGCRAVHPQRAVPTSLPSCNPPTDTRTHGMAQHPHPHSHALRFQHRPSREGGDWPHRPPNATHLCPGSGRGGQLVIVLGVPGARRVVQRVQGAAMLLVLVREFLPGALLGVGFQFQPALHWDGVGRPAAWTGGGASEQAWAPAPCMRFRPGNKMARQAPGQP